MKIVSRVLFFDFKAFLIKTFYYIRTHVLPPLHRCPRRLGTGILGHGRPTPLPSVCLSVSPLGVPRGGLAGFWDQFGVKKTAKGCPAPAVSLAFGAWTGVCRVRMVQAHLRDLLTSCVALTALG